VLNGHSSPLVRVGSTQRYRLQDDPAWRVELLQTNGAVGPDDPDNSDNNDEAFRVTTTDGTIYYFGWGRNGSNSTLTVPVYGNNTNEPCFDKSTTAADKWCQQAWRWYLDRVIDPSGNEIKYSYTRETNYYARYASTAAANRTEYDRAGLLKKIEYGFRNFSTPREAVVIDTLKRCTPQVIDSTASCGGTAAEVPGKWPDVPGDLICDASTVCANASPSFFTTNRYNQVATATVDATGNVRVVDTYTLKYTMPDPDGSGNDQPDLWLNRIDRRGSNGGEEISPPPVLFDGTSLQNRVQVPSGERTLKKFRLSSIRNELGGRVDVVYGHAPGMTCTPTYVSGISRFQSEKECFSQKYAPLGGTPHWEWFHKYVVTRVGLSDDALGYRLGQGASDATKLGQLRVFDYEYTGLPAWRYARNRNIPSDETSWTDWRGYAQTFIHTRKTQNQIVQSGDESVQRIVQYRGMNNTRKDTSGGLYNTKIETAEWGSYADEPFDQQWMAGKIAESAVQNPDGTLIERTYTGYGNLQTAIDPAGIDARVTYTSLTRTTTKVTNGSDRVHDVVTTVNDGGSDHMNIMAGAVTQVEDMGDLADPDGDGPLSRLFDDACTTTSWRSDSTTWIRVPDTTIKYSTPCNATVDTKIDSKEKNYYDNSPPRAPTQESATRSTPSTNTTATGAPPSSARRGPPPTYDVTRSNTTPAATRQI
jgi:hypothetical protein